MELIHGRHKRYVLIALGVAGLVVLVLAGYQFYDGLQRLARSRRLLRNSASELEALYRRNPFPSEANVVRLAENARTAAEWNARIMEALIERQPFGKGDAPDDSLLTPAQFIQRLNRVRRSLIEKAPAHRVRISRPDEMWFGYEALSGGQLPAATMDEHSRKTAVRLLFEQLGQIEDLVLLLYDSGIYQLEEIKRDPVYSPSTVETPERLTGEGLVGEGEIFGRFRFQLRFKTLEHGLTTVLNRLAERDALTVVTSVSVIREDDGILRGSAEDEVRGEDFPSRADGATRGIGLRGLIAMGEEEAVGQDDGEGEPSATAESAPQPEQEGAFTRIVSGPSLEKPMDVTLKLSVYKFSGGHGGD